MTDTEIRDAVTARATELAGPDATPATRAVATGRAWREVAATHPADARLAGWR